MPEKKKSSEGERLQVVLARFGLASRRGVVELIESGKVLVNGKPVLEKGARIDAFKDKIEVDGRQFSAQESTPQKVYYLFYKPKGVMTTLQDPNAEKTVADFFKDVTARLFPVGRLDRDTTGLLLMTNDGELSFQLTHPSFGVDKKYRVRVTGVVTDESAKRLEKGVQLEEGMTAPCVVRIEERLPRETVLTVILNEGKKRQIRRIFQQIGHKVLELERYQYGPLTLGQLKPGQKRVLRPEEIKALKAAGRAK
jgi:23S rRNA pseudouridine2605 synthase